MDPQKTLPPPEAENQPEIVVKTKKIPQKVFILGGVIALLLASTLSYALYRLTSSNSESITTISFPTPTTVQDTFTVVPSLTPTPQSSTRVPLPPPPDSYVIPFRTHTFQTFNNCGPATLSMALSYFDINQSQKILGDSLRPYQIPSGDNDDKSVFLPELTAKAEEYGLVAYHRPAGDIDTLKQFISHDIPVITRTWLNLEEDISHYRLVRGYTPTHLIQDDSYTNKNLSFLYSDFLALWQSFNYEYVVIAPKEKQALVEQILSENLSEKSAWEKSLAISQQEFQDNPNNFYAKFNGSTALYRLGRYQESVAMYESVQHLLPKRMLWYQLEPILAYYKLGQQDKVLAVTQNVLDNGNRAYSELHYLRAKIYESRGQAVLAKQSYDLATRYNTSSYWKANLDI